MQSIFQTNGLLIFAASDIATKKDCEEIIQAVYHGICWGSFVTEHFKCINNSHLLHHVEVESRHYHSRWYRHDQPAEAERLLESAQSLASAGILAKFTAFTTDNGKRVCLLGFCPVLQPDEYEFAVRFNADSKELRWGCFAFHFRRSEPC
jgi:hypothetical protein